MFNKFQLSTRTADFLAKERIGSTAALVLLKMMYHINRVNMVAGTPKIICEKSNFLAVNTQTNSDNIGYNLITKYPRIDYLCVDEPEFRLATTDRFGEIEDLLIKTLEKLNIKKSSITRGHLGSISYALSEQVFHTPVFSSKVVDTIGAGDAYISVTAPCVRAGLPMELVGFIGNAVGAMAVSIVGNRSVVKPVDLFKFLTVLLK